MPVLVMALLVAAVHLAIAWRAWFQLGFLADDHEFVGVAVLQHQGQMHLWQAFLPAPVPDNEVALYRPFVSLLLWLEQPLFGTSPVGYHVVNSLLHCLTALAWGTLARRWSGSSTAGLATALLFVGWPGHSEATHWIAARTNVLSSCFLAGAVYAHDIGCVRAGRSRWAWLALAVLLGVMAVGSKETGVLVGPVVAAVSWVRAGEGANWRARCLAVVRQTTPMALGLVAWLAWRAAVLGQWGSGRSYGWRSANIGPDACSDWLSVLLAPVHDAYVPPWLGHAVMGTTIVLLAFTVGALAHRPARVAAIPAGVLLLTGYAACIGLGDIDLPNLALVRYAYEAATGLAVLMGLGVAAMPARWRGAALAVVIVVHFAALDRNRMAWLRVGAVVATARDATFEQARREQQPIRVYDVPAVQDGASGWLNGYTGFLFWQATAPAGVGLRGVAHGTLEWRTTLTELAAAAAAKTLSAPTFVARWSDGALAPVTLDPQWPAATPDGSTIEYARIGRIAPFVGDAVPVQLQVRAARPLTLTAVATAADGGTWRSDPVRVEPAAASKAVACELPRAACAAAGVECAVRLEVSAADATSSFALGTVTAVAR